MWSSYNPPDRDARFVRAAPQLTISPLSVLTDNLCVMTVSIGIKVLSGSETPQEASRRNGWTIAQLEDVVEAEVRAALERHPQDHLLAIAVDERDHVLRKAPRVRHLTEGPYNPADQQILKVQFHALRTMHDRSIAVMLAASSINSILDEVKPALCEYVGGVKKILERAEAGHASVHVDQRKQDMAILMRHLLHQYNTVIELFDISLTALSKKKAGPRQRDAASTSVGNSVDSSGFITAQAIFLTQLISNTTELVRLYSGSFSQKTVYNYRGVSESDDEPIELKGFLRSVDFKLSADAADLYRAMSDFASYIPGAKKSIADIRYNIRHSAQLAGITLHSYPD